MPTNKELGAQVDQLTKLVATLVDKLPQNEVKIDNKAETVVVKTETTGEDRLNRILGGRSNPIPEDYRAAVDEILNKEFGIHLLALSGQPAFKFTVLVPQKYTKEAPYDVRPKVITYADGTNGVKSWCEKVLGTFSEEIRARVIKERSENR